MIQSGHGGDAWVQSTAQFRDQKCDTLLKPDVVLGASKAMRRREFIALLGSAVVASPLAARAQEPAKPLIGFLNSASPSAYAPMVAAFQDGLNQMGFVDGRNVAIEYHWAEGDYDLLPWFAATLVNHKEKACPGYGGRDVG